MQTSRMLAELAPDDRLLFACGKGVEDGIRSALAAGANPNVRDIGRDAAIHVLARTKPGALHILLDAGADVAAAGRKGETALHIVAGTPKNREVVELLLARGADPNAKDDNEYTPLHGAAISGSEAVPTLLEAELSTRDEAPARRARRI